MADGSVAEVKDALAQAGYLADEPAALVSFLAQKLGKPVLVEGPAGVGKTELAKALSRSTGRELIRLQSANYGQIHGRAAALERELATAAASDPELADLYSQARWQRHRGAELVAARIAELGGLAPGTDLAGAADTIYALASPDVYLLLVSDRGWAGPAYDHWLAGQLQRTLLR